MISVKNLKKSFGHIKAVDDISFEVKKGEVLGFLGPNGAGKSTTMKILTCFVAPDSGEATLNGHSIKADSLNVRASLGYVPESAPMYTDMTVTAFLQFVAEVRGIAQEKRAEAVKRVIEQCALQKVREQGIESLSKGYLRRVGLAQAFIHDPDILILDEPTDGLDPNQKFDVRNMIKKMGRDKCIIISTHILEEVEAICTRAIIIADGKILADGAPSALAAKAGGRLDKYFREITTGQKVKK